MESREKRIPHRKKEIKISAVVIPETDDSSSGESNQGILPHRKRKLCVLSDSDEHHSPKNSRLDLDNPDCEMNQLVRETSQLTISQESVSVHPSEILDYQREATPNPVSRINSDKNDSRASGDIFDSESLDDVVEHPTDSLAGIPNNDSVLRSTSNQSSLDTVAGRTKRTRQKIPQPQEWKQNKRRNARNLGLPYVSNNGVHRPGRKLLPPCNCHMRCYEKFTGRNREKIFKGYWRLGDVNRQRELIGKLIKIDEVRRHRNKEGVSRRRHTFTYRFKVGDKYTPVCKVFFLNTLGIGEKILRVVSEKTKRSETGALSPDKRGRNAPPNKLSEDDVAGINGHISLLPKVPAHWCRRDSKKTYIEGNLDQEKVYQLYRSYASRHGLRQVSKPTYVRHLNQLNIGFHQPRKDQCWCARFHELPDDDKSAQQDQYDLHVRRKEAARGEKVKDADAAENPTVMTACFDMEAILYSPWTSTKQLFYRRKLATHNFTVFSIRRKKGYCYMWPEHFGNKGSQEIATCLSKYVNEEVPNDVKILNLYADNCAGQNKNSIIATMLGLALYAHQTLRQINLKFLEVGHTYMECDTMHSTIERAARNENIYVPSDWTKIARHAKKTGNQYSVFSMSHDEFLDFKSMKDKNPRFTDSTKVKWRQAKWIQVRRDRLSSIFIKNEYWEPFKEIRLQKSFNNQPIGQLHDEPICIPKAKYNDLMYLCRSNVIPQRYHRFYANLPIDDNDRDEPNEANDGRAQVPR